MIYNYSYSYDPTGNRFSCNQAGEALTYTTNALNQYDTINTKPITYDADGNMLTRNGWTQVWNGENQMVETSKDTKK